MKRKWKGDERNSKKERNWMRGNYVKRNKRKGKGNEKEGKEKDNRNQIGKEITGIGGMKEKVTKETKER